MLRDLVQCIEKPVETDGRTKQGVKSKRMSQPPKAM
jgi:hypothetical protein